MSLFHLYKYVTPSSGQREHFLICLSQIEIVPAGEEGPRNLDMTTIMAIKGVPFLSVTEFVRAKLRVWIS
jgi:hypothetical protein